MSERPPDTPSPPALQAPLPEGRGGRGIKVLREDVSAKVKRARALRREETEAEFRLWSELRNKNLNGYKFYRQVPIGRYVVDFLCKSHRLVVEADGGQHAQSQHDDIRTRWLNANGYSVLRFWNAEIIQHRALVLDTIVHALEGKLYGAGSVGGFWPASSSPRGERCRAKRGGEGDCS